MIKFYDKANEQELELVQICFQDYHEPWLERGVIGKNGKDRYFKVSFENAELPGEITKEEIMKAVKVRGSKLRK